MAGLLRLAADLPYAIGCDADARLPAVECRPILACGEREEGFGGHTKTSPRHGAQQPNADSSAFLNSEVETIIIMPHRNAEPELSDALSRRDSRRIKTRPESPKVRPRDRPPMPIFPALTSFASTGGKPTPPLVSRSMRSASTHIPKRGPAGGTTTQRRRFSHA